MTLIKVSWGRVVPCYTLSEILRVGGFLIFIVFQDCWALVKFYIVQEAVLEVKEIV